MQGHTYLAVGFIDENLLKWKHEVSTKKAPGKCEIGGYELVESPRSSRNFFFFTAHFRRVPRDSSSFFVPYCPTWNISMADAATMLYSLWTSQGVSQNNRWCSHVFCCPNSGWHLPRRNPSPQLHEQVP